MVLELKIDNVQSFVKMMESYASRLAASPDLRSLFRNFEIIIDEIIDVPFMVLYYYNPHSHSFKAVTSKGLTKSERFIAEKGAMQRSPGKAFISKKIVYSPEEESEIDFLSDYSKDEKKMYSRLHIPLFKDDECIGVFSLGSDSKNHFSEVAISLLSYVTNIAAVVYKNLIDTRQLLRVNLKLNEINKSFLAQRLQSIGQLAAGIAHELNTPLQYVGDNISFLNNAFEMLTAYADSINLLSSHLSNYTHEEIEQIIQKTMRETDLIFFISEIPAAICQTIDGVEQLNRIIKTIKDFAQTGSKDKSFKNINKSIEDTVLITRNEWKNIIDIELNLYEDLPLVYCQSDEINQVILQILMNAINAIQDRSRVDKDFKIGTIHISTRSDAKNITIVIADDGIGIQEKNISKIFDPFFTTKQTGKGTGQGLSIAHDVVANKHKGNISVQSNYLKGSEFIVILPIN